MSASDRPLLHVDHVSRSLGGRAVVHDLSLELSAGTVLGLLGVNGAGKSTSLRMIAGVLAPDSGRVMLNGVDLAAQPGLARREIGYLPENAPLHDELSVAEYLHFCARLHGVARKRVAARVDHALQRCDLVDLRHRLLGTLSKGMRQRAGIAQAVIHEPRLIILDEPASGLDPVQARGLRGLIASLREQHALILSTHVLSDVVACCDEVAILHQGRLRHHQQLAASQSAGELLVELDRVVDVDDWQGMGAVQSVRSSAARQWHVLMRENADAAALATGIVARGWGLRQLRPSVEPLEHAFMEIAAGDAPAVTQ